MNKQQSTPRAAVAVRTVRIARALTALVPEIATVRLRPVWTDGIGEGRRQTLVSLHYSNGRPIGADLDAHRAARAMIRANFAGVDWDRSHAYDVRTGRLMPTDAPQLPAAPATAELDDETGR